MARFVLVHGAFGGAWSWGEFMGELERAGHTATAIDLPGSGEEVSLSGMIVYESFVNIQRDPSVYGETASDFMPDRASPSPRATRSITSARP